MLDAPPGASTSNDGEDTLLPEVLGTVAGGLFVIVLILLVLLARKLKHRRSNQNLQEQRVRLVIPVWI